MQHARTIKSAGSPVLDANPLCIIIAVRAYDDLQSSIPKLGPNACGDRDLSQLSMNIRATRDVSLTNDGPLGYNPRAER